MTPRDTRDELIEKLAGHADVLEEWADDAEFAHKLHGPCEDEPLTPRFEMFAPHTRDIVADIRAALALLRATARGWQSVGHQYEFHSVYGGTEWRDNPAQWNGRTPIASREIFARVPSPPAQTEDSKC